MRRVPPVYFVLSLFTLISTADAAPITFRFSGQVTDVGRDNVFRDIGVGDPFDGSYTFDPSLVAKPPDGSATGNFEWSTPFGMTANIGEHVFNAFGLLNIGIANDSPGFGDQYSLVALSVASDLRLDFLLLDSTGAVFPDAQLPLKPPAMDRFDATAFRLHAVIGSEDVFIDGQIDTLTLQESPEPSAALAVASGMILVLLVRKRSR